jgi:hypothetical protein
VRFLDEVFPEVAETDDVAYGAAINRWTGQSETLLLDVYEPLGDTAAARPAVVVVHLDVLTGQHALLAVAAVVANHDPPKAVLVGDCFASEHR